MSRATDLLLESAMSALVHYRTSWLHKKASALPLKPDILRAMRQPAMYQLPLNSY